MEKQKPRKKSLPLIISLSSVGVLFTASISVSFFYYIGLKDGTKIDFELDKSLTKEDIFNDVIVDSYNSFNNDSVNAKIDIYQLNTLINLGLEESKKETNWNNVVNKLAVETSEDNYVLNAECNKTRRVYMYTSKTVENDNSIYKVNNVKLSKFNYPKMFPRKYKEYVSNENFEKLFKASSLSIQPDLENSRFIYNTKDFVKDISTNDLFSEILLMNEFTPTNDSLISFKVSNLSILDNSLINPLKDNTIDLSDLKKEVNEIIKTNPFLKGKEKELIEFLLKGSNKTSEDFLNILKDADLSTSLIEDVSHFDGDFPSLSDNLPVTVLEESRNNLSTYLLDKKVATIDEDHLLRFFKATSFAGSTCVKYSRIIDDFAYISVNDIGLDVKSNNIKLYSALSLNGVNAPLLININNKENIGYKMNLEIGDIFLGSKAVNEIARDYIIDTFTSSFDGFDYVSFSNNKISIDFENMIDEDMKLQIEAFSFDSLSFDLTEEGNLEIYSK